MNYGINNSDEVMRRDFGGHAYGDTLRTHQKELGSLAAEKRVPCGLPSKIII